MRSSSFPLYLAHVRCCSARWERCGRRTAAITPFPRYPTRLCIERPKFCLGGRVILILETRRGSGTRSTAAASSLRPRASVTGAAAALARFVYFPKTHRYLMFGNPPGLGRSGTSAWGIADDNSVAVSAHQCSTGRNFIYLVTPRGTRVRWSKPCACTGYMPQGVNLDGIGLNNYDLGPAVLTFRSGSPQITPLPISVGAPADAYIQAVGTPRGFVGTQDTDPDTGFGVPTVWLRGQPYALPVAGVVTVASALDEHQTPSGPRIDVVGCDCNTGGVIDYWQGTPAADGFSFTEDPGLITTQDMAEIWGISTDGSMVFGDFNLDAGDGTSAYLPASQFEISDPCGGGQAFGDSHGDVLVDDSGGQLCLAQPVPGVR